MTTDTDETLTLDDVHATWLERSRSIPVEIAARYHVVSMGKNLGFEYREQGKLLYRKARVIHADGTKTFHRDRKGVPATLWNLDSLAERSDQPLIITEGEIDALSALATGFQHVVSVPDGAQRADVGKDDIDPTSDTAFAWLWKDGKLRPELRDWRRIILATDGDEKGAVLREELAVRLGPGRCWWLTYPDGCKDLNDVLHNLGDEAVHLVVGRAKPVVPPRLVPFGDIIEQASRPVYSSGWSGLDNHLLICPPELIVVTGVPGSGKSQFALNLGANMARLHGLKGAIMQFEDNPERNRRDLLRYAKAWHGDGATYIKEDPRTWIDRMFLTMAPERDDEPEDRHIKWLQDRIEEAALRHDCKWIIIDPWNEVEHVWRVTETEAGYTNAALRDLKRITRRYQIALIIVAHPSKGVIGKSLDDMSLYDISGSAAWKNKADHGIIVHRDKSTGATDTLIKVDKSKDWRTMGVPGTVRMAFDPSKAAFSFRKSEGYA